MSTSSPALHPQISSLRSLSDLPFHPLAPHHRRTSSQSVASSPLLDAAPSYLVEWAAGGVAVRTPLPTPEDLRAVVTRGRGGGGAAADRLLVLRGLPAEHLKALRASLDIDPAFVEAHAGRRRYRPVRWRKDADFACFAYPELVGGFRGVGGGRGDAAAGSADPNQGPAAAAVAAVRVVDQAELLPAPELRAISEDGDMAAALCRVSLWLNPQMDVVLVDRAPWREPGTPLRKARRPAVVAGRSPQPTRPSSPAAGGKGSFESRLADGEEVGGLEDELYRSLKDAADVGEALTNILAELAYDRWLDLFELMAPRPPAASGRDLSTVYWELGQALEQNVAVAGYLAARRAREGLGGHGHPSASSAYPDWAALLARLSRREALVPLTLPPAPRLIRDGTGGKKPVRQQTTTTSTSAGSRGAGAGRRLANRSRSHGHGASAASLGTTAAAEDESQRALNRVSYLGAVLLPFSIVSGILSMSDPFGPENDRFWVFWTAAVPLTLVCVLVIYADIIRKAEVWVEVAAEGVQAAIFAGDGGAVVGRGTEQGRRLTWYRLGGPATAAAVAAVAVPGSEEGAGKANGKISVGGRTTSVQPRPALRYTEGDEAVVIDMPSTPATEEAPEATPGGTSAVESDSDAEVVYDNDDVVGPTMILQRRSDGSRPMAWKRQQLGWYGAVKAILGYNKPRRDVPLGIGPLERRQTSTY